MRRLVALLLALTTIIACSGDGDDDAPDDGDSAPTTGTTQVAIDGGRLVVGLEEAVAGLDPAQGVFSPSGLSAALAVFDPLLAVRSDGDVVPYLADSFELNDDATRMTILLREGVAFSDGTPVDAAAVVAALDRLVASPTMQHLVRPLASVAALGPMAVEITSEPWPELPSLLAGQLGLVAAPTMTDPRQPIGSGPFVVGEWVDGQGVTLTANASYWRAGERVPFVDELELRFVPDAAQRVALLERGDVDVVHVSGEDAIAALRDADGVTFTEPASSDRAVVVLAAPAFECVAAVAAGDDDECDEDVAFTVRTDQPDAVVEPVVDRWEDAGFDVTVETADAASIAIDRLVGDLQVVLTVDDGLLPMGRPDGSAFVQTVVESIPWAYGTGAKVGGVPGSLPLPGGEGETLPVPGVVIPAALHRTR